MFLNTQNVGFLMTRLTWLNPNESASRLDKGNAGGTLVIAHVFVLLLSYVYTQYYLYPNMRVLMYLAHVVLSSSHKFPKETVAAVKYYG